MSVSRGAGCPEAVRVVFVAVPAVCEIGELCLGSEEQAGCVVFYGVMCWGHRDECEAAAVDVGQGVCRVCSSFALKVK